eukprot:scaffold3749_cov457-Prasinococcus_capsulatus_cf.AAC.7
MVSLPPVWGSLGSSSFVGLALAGDNRVMLVAQRRVASSGFGGSGACGITAEASTLSQSLLPTLLPIPVRCCRWSFHTRTS